MQLVVLTSHQRMQLAVSGKVLKLPQTEAVQHCDDVMRQANGHAQAIIDEANQEGDAIRARATEDAQRIAQEIIAASVIQAGLIKQAAAAMLEKQLLDIVLSSLKAVLKEQPPSQLMTQALHILRSSMAQARWINVLVHPSKQHVATHAVSQFQSQVPLRGVINVVPTPTVSEDSCVIESDAGSADASVHAQLTNLTPAIERTVQSLIRHEGFQVPLQYLLSISANTERASNDELSSSHS